MIALEKVDYLLLYHRIDIHPLWQCVPIWLAHTNLTMKAKMTKILLSFFEENGVKICAIIKAMNYGLNDSWYEAQEFFNTAAQYFEDGIIVLQKAFKKFEKLAGKSWLKISAKILKIKISFKQVTFSPGAIASGFYYMQFKLNFRYISFYIP